METVLSVVFNFSYIAKGQLSCFHLLNFQKSYYRFVRLANCLFLFLQIVKNPDVHDLVFEWKLCFQCFGEHLSAGSVFFLSVRCKYLPLALLHCLSTMVLSEGIVCGTIKYAYPEKLKLNVMLWFSTMKTVRIALNMSYLYENTPSYQLKYYAVKKMDYTHSAFPCSMLSGWLG